jgi:signal transduction histidine kinase
MSLLSSLTNRIFLGSAILVTVAIGVAVDRVNRVETTQADKDLRERVDGAAALVTDYVVARQGQFLSEVKIIGVLPLLTNAIATDDPPTVQGVARDYGDLLAGDLLAPDLFLVLGRNGRVLARVGRLPPDLVSTQAVVAARPVNGDATWFWPYSGGLLLVTALPTGGGAAAPLGSLVLGFSLDQAAVENIKARTQSQSDIALVAGGRVLAATLSPSLANALPAYAGEQGSFDVTLGSDEFIGRVQPIGGAPNRTAGSPVAIVLQDRTERLAALRGLQREVLLAGLAAVLVATLIGYAIARTVTRPLRAVTATMRRMAATGDLTQPPPAEGRWDDEDARLLARTFRQMTAALDRFRREAAQRERLSSLGRLSTVVAHEVRNPLMIIKSAVRSLRRQPSPEVATIAASIDEEVSRLNRVVTDVLDFARPIQFDLAPADLVEICRDAAHAAQAGTDDVPVAIEAAEGRAPVVTDAERLRTVLVNVLSNAQQAVRARGDQGLRSPIRLQTTRNPSGGWRIEVADRGAGISRDDLPRLFEPFFTTRRTGSGLGLALARNIVEGLGGSIAIDSTAGVGTIVCIDVPERAAAQEVQA